jgi:small conductance mechanosensitive channel
MPGQNRAEWLQTLDDWHLLTASKVIVVVVIALILSWLSRKLIRRMVHGMHSLRGSMPGSAPQDLHSERRARTLTAVLRSAAAAIIWSIAAISILSDLGVNVGAFIAGASIIGGALAFGAQQIVRDLLAGFFMFSEDQYTVGDSVDLGLAQGTVEEVSLRVTRLRDAEGKVWFVPHGQIQRVANLSQEWSLAIVDVTVPRARDVQLPRFVRESRDALRQIGGYEQHVARLCAVPTRPRQRRCSTTGRSGRGAHHARCPASVQRRLRARLVTPRRTARSPLPPPAPWRCTSRWAGPSARRRAGARSSLTGRLRYGATPVETETPADPSAWCLESEEPSEASAPNWPARCRPGGTRCPPGRCRSWPTPSCAADRLPGSVAPWCDDDTWERAFHATAPTSPTAPRLPPRLPQSA